MCWPGSLGSPRQASAALGDKIRKSFASAALVHALKDPRRRHPAHVRALRRSAREERALPELDPVRRGHAMRPWE